MSHLLRTGDCGHHQTSARSSEAKYVSSFFNPNTGQNHISMKVLAIISVKVTVESRYRSRS